MGYLDEHSSLIANIWHLKTSYVSPQFHVVFDDLFKTVFSSGADDALVDFICKNLYRTNCEIYATDEYDAHNNLVLLEEEVPTELKVLLTLTGTLTSLIITPL